MSRYVAFLNYALNGLRRGGQRVMIAVLAVAFGVMSLISMSSIANSIDHTLNNDDRTVHGGDLRLSQQGEMFDETLLETFETLQSEGLISAYTPVSETYALLMRTEDSGKANFLNRGLGVDPASYPIIGDMVPGTPENVSSAELLRETGAVLVTRDIANQYDLAVGDTLRLAQSDGTVLAQPVVVRGILDDTPDHSGASIYYNLDTARQLLGDDAILDYVLANAGDVDLAVAPLASAGWAISRADDQQYADRSAAEFFNFMLRGAGVLGLIVGGIGIANTMTVLLERRQKEIGVLKTLGYAQRDMIAIFVMEAGLLGLTGSLIGAALAVMVSNGLTTLFANMSSLLIVWRFDALLTVSGLIIGVVTTILFAAYAILRASRVRPTVIFRREAQTNGNWRQWLKAAGFYAVMAVPFAGVTSFILGSVVEGVGILLFALGGLVGMGIAIGGFTWVLLRFLPVLNFNLLRMARNNMRKRAFSMLFAMIALFVGIFTLGFALTVIQVGLDQFAIRQDTSEDYNLLVYGDVASASEIERLLDNANVLDWHYMLPVEDMRINGETTYEDTLHIRDRAWDIEIVEGAPLGEAYGVYVYAPQYATAPDEMEIIVDENTRFTLPVIGRYGVGNSLIVNTPSAPVISRNTMEALGLIPERVNAYAIVEQSRENDIAQQIGDALPQTMTLTRSNVLDAINDTFINLLGFALAMSGLALLAGVMLVANVVSLAMIERRYEIGVMKAVGYTRRHVLVTLALEYGLIGVVASIAGIVGVQVMISLITLTQAGAVGVLWMSPTVALIILAVGILLTLLTALAAAWEPTRTRPLAVLNAQG